MVSLPQKQRQTEIMDRDKEPTEEPSSSSEKKKQKKEKKRKHRDDVVSTSPMVNGTKNGSGRGKNKAKKEGRREKDENVKGSAVDENGPTSVRGQQSAKISQALSPSKESQTTRAKATTTTTATTTAAATSADKPEFVFSSLVAKSLSSDTSKLKRSPYRIKTMQGSVALLPSSLPDVPTCIKSRLKSLLLMYDANMGGVLLSLEEATDRGNNVSTTSRYTGGLIGGRIVDDLPYIHYRFQAKGLIFCPIVGMKLKGQVVECTPTFVTLTTHHIISTKISTERLHQQGFFFNSVSMEWTREREISDAMNGEEDANNLGPSTSIYLDDIVEFFVERIHECGGYISLDGTRPSVSTG
ncbi:hypothetical protein ACHAXA_004984 [Cyclostephanos tholiformis]|uniref:Uncharacterized protein n=1 Tax=Cyclostephanos tholiformis TaxID=382380 RepID=A0ABD3R5E6_9STRA